MINLEGKIQMSSQNNTFSGSGIESSSKSHPNSHEVG